jgi:hypothetical protein
MRPPISENLSVKAVIAPISGTAATRYSSFAQVKSTLTLLAILSVGVVGSSGTIDIAIEQAALNKTASGVVTTAPATAADTALIVSGGTYVTNDWVSPDGGVSWVRVTSGLVGAGSLAVTAIPFNVASGAAILAVGNSSVVATLSSGPNGFVVPEAPATSVPAIATAPGTYMLDVRGIDLNGNNPSLPGDGTSAGNNPAYFARIKIVTAVATSQIAGLLLSDDRVKPAYLNDDVAAGTVARVFA